MATDNLPVQEFKLEQDQELRFEIENKDKAYLTLKAGNAEIFGTEIVKGKSYEFASGAKVAVFTWQGCTLELRGKTDVSYVAKETPMVMYANCHAALEQMRIAAETDNKRGPVTIVTGPSDVGKSTVCRILLNYAVRMCRRPVFVDLDLGQGQIGIPGTVGALLVERPAAPTSEDGFSQEAPLVYHVGHKSPDGNVALYNLLTAQLAHTVLDRIDSNKKTRMSGVLINTCGWVKGTGYKHLLKSISSFEVDVVLCLDQERLYNELVRDVPSFVKVVFLPKSGGVVERTKGYRREARDQRVREYFYGTTKNSLYPHSFDVKWSEMKLYKIGAPALPASCLPLGMKPQDHLTKLVPITPNAGILHHILAVSFAEKDDDQMIKSHVAGFVCVTNVDTDRQTVTVLSPQPKPLPNQYLLLSDTQFMDNH